MANPVKPLVWCCGYTYLDEPLSIVKCRACGKPIAKAAKQREAPVK